MNFLLKSNQLEQHINVCLNFWEPPLHYYILSWSYELSTDPILGEMRLDNEYDRHQNRLMLNPFPSLVLVGLKLSENDLGIYIAYLLQRIMGLFDLILLYIPHYFKIICNMLMTNFMTVFIPCCTTCLYMLAFESLVDTISIWYIWKWHHLD